MATQLSVMATRLKSLHVPGKPLVLANVYDYLSADAVAGLSSCNALATASYAVASAAGVSDDELTLETNVAAAKLIGKVAAKHDKPLTVDLQDGYGTRLEEAIVSIVAAGAVGINLEDFDRGTDAFFPADEAANRIKTVLETARRQKIPDFVVNARCDTLVHGGSLEETIARGRAYLDAGATSVFVWGGGKRGISKGEIVELVKGFDGRLNVSMKMGVPDALGVKELSALGVSRISVGPRIQMAAVRQVTETAEALLSG